MILIPLLCCRPSYLAPSWTNDFPPRHRKSSCASSEVLHVSVMRWAPTHSRYVWQPIFHLSNVHKITKKKGTICLIVILCKTSASMSMQPRQLYVLLDKYPMELQQQDHGNIVLSQRIKGSGSSCPPNHNAFRHPITPYSIFPFSFSLGKQNTKTTVSWRRGLSYGVQF